MKLSSREASALRVVLLSVFIVAIASGAVWLLWLLRDIVFLGIAAAFAAFLFLPVAHWLNQKTHFPMGVTCFIVVLGILALFVGLVAVTIPPLVHETRLLFNSLPEYVKTVQGYFSRFSLWLDRYELTGAKDALTAVFDSAQKALVQVGQNFVMTSPRKLLSLSALLPFFVIMYFFMRSSHEYYEIVLSLPFVRSRKDRAGQALAQIALSTRKYIEALALVAIITALLMGGVSALCHINYALTIGVVDFFGEFIPYAGPLIVALLGAFFAAVSGPGKLILWIVVFGVIESTTSQILAPRLISDKTGINPGLVILLLLAGGKIAGFWGLLLAVPATVFIREIIRSARYLRTGSEKEDVLAKSVD